MGSFNFKSKYEEFKELFNKWLGGTRWVVETNKKVTQQDLDDLEVIELNAYSKYSFLTKDEKRKFIMEDFVYDEERKMYVSKPKVVC